MRRSNKQISSFLFLLLKYKHVFVLDIGSIIFTKTTHKNTSDFTQAHIQAQKVTKRQWIFDKLHMQRMCMLMFQPACVGKSAKARNTQDTRPFFARGHLTFIIVFFHILPFSPTLEQPIPLSL